MEESATSTVVLGFDGLDFRYLNRFRDDLPNFTALRANGVESRLRSTHPPWTGSAWPSMYTGVEPGYHGCYTFFDYGRNYPDEARLISRNQVKQPALWNYLTALDEPSVVLNVPVTHPADAIKGVLIPGYLAEENESGHPPEIRDEISEALGEPYRIYSRGELSSDDREKLRGYLELIDLRGRAASYLLEAYDWRIAVVQVQKTDAIFHNFDDPDVFRRVYRAADEVVGSVLDAVGDETNVVVCSDHGNGPIDGYRVFVNEILRRRGFVETTSSASMPTLGGTKSKLLGENATRDTSSRAKEVAEIGLSKLGSVLTTAGITLGDIHEATRRVGLDGVVRDLPISWLLPALRTDIDWRNSKAYCRTESELGIRINLRGREPSGVVPQEEYKRVRTELIDLLSALRTPTGDPVFEWVRPREEVYDGPHAERSCDVLYKPVEMNHKIRPDLVGETFLPTNSYNHRQCGIFIATGPAFESDARIEEFSLTDVAPLALASAGQPVPNRMTGSVPDFLIERSGDRIEFDIRQQVSDDEINEGKVERRLDDLGYL